MELGCNAMESRCIFAHRAAVELALMFSFWWQRKRSRGEEAEDNGHETHKNASSFVRSTWLTFSPGDGWLVAMIAFGGACCFPSLRGASGERFSFLSWRRKDVRLTFDLIDIESGRIVKLPWVNLTSPKAGK